jgi:hypothetical protein
LLILYSLKPGPGWHPITYMVKLAEELFEAEVLILASGSQSGPGPRLQALLPRSRGTETCLVICPHAPDLLALLQVEGWRRRFRRVAAWIIDSFWIDRIPTLLRHTRLFDRVFIAIAEDLPDYRRLLRTPVDWLPGGADALRLGLGAPEREWDLLRVGRQPPEWEPDADTEHACCDWALRFHGRPPLYEDATDNQRALMRIQGRSKFVLAFSNRVDPHVYTHSTREYLTGRWLDALACGASVAGVPPRSHSAEQMLWPGACLDRGTIRRQEGLPILAEVVRPWRPEQAATNHRLALERLDWRWRFAAIAEALEEAPPHLEAELKHLRRALADHSGQVVSGPGQQGPDATRSSAPGHS